MKATKFWLGIKKNVSSNTWRITSYYTCLRAGIFRRPSSKVF